MSEVFHKRLNECLHERIEVKTKNNETIRGILSWISPDHTMVEITLKDGQIKTLLDKRIVCFKVW